MPLQLPLKTFAIDPASLRHRIELRRLQFDDDKPWDDAGAEITIATLWAAILSLSDREGAIADQLHPQENLQFLIRYRADLAGPLSLHHDGKIYDVTSITDPDQRHIWLILSTTRKVGS